MPQAARSDASPGSPDGSHGERVILVVDDHAPTRRGYAALLTECGYSVVEAAHGGEAILRVHEGRPDLILMDLDMPVVNGLEAATALRAYAPMSGVPIVAVTASESRWERERMAELCDDLLMKPCGAAQIAERIRSLLERAAP